MNEIAAHPACQGYPQDVYGQRGFLAEFEREVAELFGLEAGVFMPSGTMAQQIALRIWADRSENPVIAFHPKCHLECHEQMAYEQIHHLRAVLLGEPERLFTIDDLKKIEEPIGTLLIELPQRDLGGQLPTWEDLCEIVSYAKSKGMRVHLDGARLWQCEPFYGRSLREICELFDSVYVSFYKDLNGLPGALLLGPADFVAESRIWLRRHGGNLFTQFPAVISAKIGMEKYLPKMPLYVAKAKEVSKVLALIEGVQVIPPLPHTNMMHLAFDIEPERLLDAVGQVAKAEGVLLFNYAGPCGDGCRTEVSLGDASLDLSDQEIGELFSRLMVIARDS